VFDLAGKTIGKYRLVEKLGQGGMAQVYKAYQPDLDRYIAVKILHPHLTGDPEFEARFRREARAVAALEHPNIVRIYDFDTAEGLAFLVMEYVEGTNLRTRLRDMAGHGELLDLSEVVQIAGSLADALDYAHRQGVVHRDLKPSNILIDAEGRPVLNDFGIARMLDATAITESGGSPGTPAYMSPEQGQGQPGDARSDIYALGVLLYQLCTGQVPFDADTPYAIILKHITAPLPPPHTLRPDLPEAVERVILKAMAKDPAGRFQSAGEMGCALRVAFETTVQPLASSPGGGRMAKELPSLPTLDRHWAKEPPSLASREGLRKSGFLLRRILPFAIAAIAILGGVLLLGWRLGWFSPTPATVQPTVLAGGRAFLVLEGPAVAADTWLDPDGPATNWADADLVHLQGPLTPDRLLFRFDLAGLPAGATIVSATLALQVELWGDQSLPGAAVAYRVLTPWQPTSATYEVPWTAPGLSAGWDYDSVPLGMAPVPDLGALVLDVTPAVIAWAGGQPNNGLVVMMAADSHNQSHHWVMMTEQPSPADRPTLRIAYEPSRGVDEAGP
jgi:tRNA A-37 threonylcarbamoyl transferase component Bud32